MLTRKPFIKTDGSNPVNKSNSSGLSDAEDANTADISPLQYYFSRLVLGILMKY